MSRHKLAAIFAGALLLVSGATAAFSCACCTYPTQRSNAVDKLDSSRSDDIARLRFAPEAKLLLGEANDIGLPGMPEPEEDWRLAVTRQKDRLIFSLRDGKGRAGALTFVLPKSLSVFMADTRDGKDTGFGPTLYTEWVLTSPFSGDGIFRVDAAKNRRLTLILQGRGSSCTDADAFTHWMLSSDRAASSDSTARLRRQNRTKPRKRKIDSIATN